jgi:hypothetical protein
MLLFSLRWIFAISLTLMVATPAAAASSAKAALTQVKAAAATWQADAVLTHISTLTAKSDGKANSWLYTVYSPKAKKSAIITARDGKIEVEPDVRNTYIAPLTTDFLDSDKVVEAARKAGLKTGKDGIGLGLTTFGQATGKPRVYWTVTVMGADSFSSVTLDPKDGTLIKRDDVKL